LPARNMHTVAMVCKTLKLINYQRVSNLIFHPTYY
jgi:hypothetical protein